MAKKTNQPVEANEQEEKKSRKRNEYLLLVRKGKDQEWVELCVMHSQPDCKACATAIRKILEEEGIDVDGMEFTLRVVKSAAELF